MAELDSTQLIQLLMRTVQSILTFGGLGLLVSRAA
jgi:hypothetical protein